MLKKYLQKIDNYIIFTPMKTAGLILLFSFLFLSSCEETCIQQEEIAACEDFHTMPDGSLNQFIRFVEVLPNPTGADSANEFLTFRNYSQQEVALGQFRFAVDNELNKPKLSEISDMLMPCDSITLNFINPNLFPNNSTEEVPTVLYLFDSKGNRIIQQYSYFLFEEGERVRITK